MKKRGGGYIWPVMPIFELRWATPVKSHVLKFGLDWLKSEVAQVNFEGGAEAPIRVVICDLRCPFSNLAELFQSNVMREYLVRIGWAFQELLW